MDITHSLPSCINNAPFDYLPALLGPVAPERPACAAWPSPPPRSNHFADDSLLAHPLTSLLMARSWAGAPPTYLCVGWELLADENKHAASRLHADNVPMVFEEYEAMPHCFALIFENSPATRRCYDAWAGFIRKAVEDPASLTARSSFVCVKARTLRDVPLDPKKLSPFSDDDVRARIRRKVNDITAVAKL
jgi:acetyl esterase/lipase